VFLTWRLWGSVAARHGYAGYPTPGHAFVAADRELDLASSGPGWLEDPSVAEIIAEAIQAGEHTRQYYELLAWVVMPHHVHMLILPKVPIAKLMRWLKGSTARHANQHLARTGQPFWRDESYDHYVRSRDELGRIAAYIERNPVSVGLVDSPELWRWSSHAENSGRRIACLTLK
jgi:putative transposase